MPGAPHLRIVKKCSYTIMYPPYLEHTLSLFN